MDSKGSRELADRVNSGDDEALRELIARMAPLIKAQVRRRAPREALLRESVEDLAQSVCREVFERVDRGGFEFRGEAALRAWLTGAVDLKLGERWRRAHAAQRADEPRAEAFDARAVPGNATSPSRAYARAEAKDRFDELLKRLPPEDREIVRAVHVAGSSHSDVAAKLGITESHSRTRLARALARLATWTSTD